MADPAQFKRAYLRSRFFHGEDYVGHTRAHMQTSGIAVLGRATYPGSTDPVLNAPPTSRGPIYLGLTYEIGKDYGTTGVVRVFLDITRAAYLRPGGTGQLNAEKFGQYQLHAQTQVFDYLYRDYDNPNAALTGTDIPANCCWGSRLSLLVALGPTDPRAQLITDNIRSFDNSLPADTASLLGLMIQCVGQGLIGDRKNADTDKNTIPSAPPTAPLQQPPEVEASNTKKKRSGMCSVM